MKLSDLKKREYKGQDCISFEYVVECENQNIKVCFEKLDDAKQLSDNTWHMMCILEKTHYMDTQVYNIELNMPKQNMPLTLICETGLRFLKLLLVEEIKKKQDIQFTIGEVIGLNDEEVR